MTEEVDVLLLGVALSCRAQDAGSAWSPCDALAGQEYLGDIDADSDRAVAHVRESYSVVLGDLRLDAVSDGDLECVEEITGGLYVTDSTMEELRFPALRRVGAKFHIGRNDQLTRLSFPALESVAEDIWISGHPVLEDLDGFESFVEARYHIDLIDNEALVDLDGWHTLEYVGGDLGITGNTALADEEIDELVEAIGEENIGGDVTRD